MAINFPDTAGQATDGTFTYTVAGITYAWNGSSWAAAGAGASATNRSLFSVTTNSASGGGSLSYDTSSGGFTYTPPDLSGFLSAEADTLTTVTGRGATTSNNIFLGDSTKLGFGANGSRGNVEVYYDQANLRYTFEDVTGCEFRFENNVGGNATAFNFLKGGSTLARMSAASVDLWAGGTQRLETTSTGVTITGALTAGGLTYPTTNGSSGQVLTSDGSGNVTWTNGGLQSRTTSASGLNTLANSASATPNITTPKTYALLGIETTHAAWVVLYNSDAARTADQSRGINVDPVAGSGVLAEVITTGAQTQYLSPGVICYNTQTTGTTYARVTNLSGSTASVNVTLTYVQLEA
tara:strand:+ start:31 stop:1086 length:1056 start_codon:yes stop_codon:yes gene_type:complete